MSSFTLELEISFSKKLLTAYKSDPKLEAGSIRTLEKKLDTAIVIRNTARGEALKRLHKLQHDRTYQQLQEEYATRKKKDPKADVSDLSPKYRECMNFYGYTEYALQSYVIQAKHQYHDILGADECQKLATQAFRAVDGIRTKESKKVRFLQRTSDSSVEGKSGKSTLKYIGDCCIQFGKGNIYPLVIKKKDHYAQEALTHKVKYVRLIRKTIRRKRRYFAQLILEGTPPKTKHLKYGKRDQRVGLDEGTSTIAIVTQNEVSLKELAPEVTTDEKELRRLNRAIDRSKRAMNPDNYHEDGTVKKGRHQWIKSKHCLILEARRKELYRRAAQKRQRSHNQLANHIVSLGTDVRVEEMRMKALAKRSSKTTKNKKNGRIRSKKRYGKVISNRAPATLIATIDRKLRYIGFSIQKVDTAKVRASQYDHISNTYKKKQLSDRWHIFPDGTRVQRDMYSGFLVFCTAEDLKHIDRDLCIRNYQKFKRLHDQEVERLRKENKKALRWYIA